MKKLIFIRHGKAENAPPEILDFERSLTLKGKINSRLMARKLIKKEHSPGIMVTSPAFRAIETAYIFAGEFGIDPEKIIIKSNLYFKMNFHSLQEFLSQVSEKYETIMLFGHNPSFTEIADVLCKGGCNILPKCGIICISFNVGTWPEIRMNSGKTEYFLKPEKML